MPSRKHSKSKLTVSAHNQKKFLLILFALIALLAFLYLFKFSQFYSKIYTARSGPSVTKIPKDKKVFNILLMGYGGANHEGAYLTDSMMLIHVDLEKKRTAMISLPRDLWVKVPTKTDEDFHAKINSVYQMGLFPRTYPNLKDEYKSEQGAGDLVKLATFQVTGLPTDYYLAVDFEGFKRAVEILGGVDVNVARTFDDFEYPIDGKEDDACELEGEKLDEALKIATQEPQLAFPCRYEPLHFDAGLAHMDGPTALKYVRSRHSEQDGGDFGRAARQQLFLDAVKKKVLSIGFIPKIIPLFDQLGNNVRTDMPLEITQKLLKEATKMDGYTVVQTVLSEKTHIIPSYSNDRQYILVPTDGPDQWNPVHQYILNTIQGITPTLTPIKR